MSSQSHVSSQGPAMGLDAVELVMSVEDRFGIRIRQAEFGSLQRVGDLVTLVQRRIQAAHEAGCPTLKAFLKLRRTVREMLQSPDLPIRPGHRLSDVLTPVQLKQLWRLLPGLLEGPAPDLQRPRWVRLSFIAVAVLLFLAAVCIVAQTELAVLPLTIVAALFVMWGMRVLTRPLCSIPPTDWTHFGEIAREIAGIQAASQQLHLRTPEEVLDELRPIIVDLLAVAPSEVVPEARFIKDLGMG